MSRFSLRLQSIVFRFLVRIVVSLDIYLSRPLPNSASFKKRIRSTVASVPGTIEILFYTPTSYTKPSPKEPRKLQKHPLLVNFHGGGWSIGRAKDDARWAAAVTSQTIGVVASVDYRLAPEYPFPTGVEDCVSAVLYLWNHAEELNLDISRTSFSGFSAGGNFCYAVAYRLHEELSRLKEKGELTSELEKGKLVSLAVFYGSVEFVFTRAERDASNPDLIPAIPNFLYRFFDASYLYPQPLDMKHPFLSPALAEEKLVVEALPKDVLMVDCGGDQLLKENDRWKVRMEGLGKRVKRKVVEGVPHGWDKNADFGKGTASRDEAYAFATEGLKEVWG